MSILNRINVDTTKQPIFLGEKLGLQRFDRFKYPIFFDLFSKQLTFIWRPEEIQLTLDRVQYQELEEHEKFIFTKNILFQTMLDSVVARGVPTFTQHVSNPELEICLNTWGFMEGIHSYSYTYLIRNIYSDPSKILDQALLDPEILKRADSVTKAYDDLSSAKMNLKEKIYLSLISVNILEAVRFYVSFVCAFAFGQSGRMVGNADIVKLIRRDEACVDKETQVLTIDGWKNINTISTNDKIAQYHNNGDITFVYPQSIINKEYRGDLLFFNNKKNHINMMLTPDHRIIYKSNDKVYEQSAGEFKFGGTKKIPVAGKLKGSYLVLSDYDRFLIALQADGSIRDMGKRNGKISGCHCVDFTFSKRRKIERLTYLLDNLKFEYNTFKDKRDRTVFNIKVPIEYKLTKIFREWVPKLDRLNSIWCSDFIEEAVLWDGHIRSKQGSYYYSSSVEDNTEMVQIIASMSGYKTHRYEQEDGRKESYKTMHRLSILKYTDYHTAQKIKKEIIPHNGNVYCVSVPTGMFVARRNNAIFITGNCHLYITQNIINILRSNEEEGFVEVIDGLKDEAIKMFLDAANEEKAWASYLFQYGSIIGLSEQVIHQYIEWLVDSRMKELGLPKQFNSKNPIGGWIDSWMDSSKVQVAPQETEITSYKIGASVNDIGDMEF